MKLIRVAMLLPVCIVIGMALHIRGAQAARSAPVLPWFAVVFAMLVAAGSAGWLPPALVSGGGIASSWLLVTAIAAIGMKTSLRALVDMGVKPVLLMVGETAFLGAVVLAAVAWQ